MTAALPAPQETFNDIVRTASWLDESTRTRALEKLDALRDRVSYPDWLMDNAELDESEALALPQAQDFAVQKGRYFETHLLHKHLMLVHALKDLRLPVNHTKE